MKKILVFLLLSYCSQPCWSEIRSFVLDKIEITDADGTVKTAPITADVLDRSLKKVTKKEWTGRLTVAGLGTNRVTAQGPGWGLCIETQIFPMDKPDFQIEGRTDKAEWFYAVHDQGVTVIELKSKEVKLHNLGLVPYTYVGIPNK